MDDDKTAGSVRLTCQLRAPLEFGATGINLSHDSVRDMSGDVSAAVKCAACRCRNYCPTDRRSTDGDPAAKRKTMTVTGVESVV